MTNELSGDREPRTRTGLKENGARPDVGNRTTRNVEKRTASERRTGRQGTGALAALCVSLALAILGGGYVDAAPGDDPATAAGAGQPVAGAPLVVATVGMIGDVAREVAGECAVVETLMGPGSDPHLYRPSAGDVRLLDSADLVLYGGLHLEAGLSEVLASFAARKPTVAVSETAVAEPERLAATGALAAAGRAAGAANAAGVVYDPHVWMDVALWSGAAAVIADAIAQRVGDLPGCQEAVAARSEQYRSSLQALDGWAAEALASVPAQQRVLITAHDAFAYFGRAYGVEVEGVQGVSTETEAAVADIRRVADIVIARSVPAVFVESTINPRTVQAVLEAVEQRGGDVAIGDLLYADALGAEDSSEGTYVGMVVHNVTAIAVALGGEVPPLPSALATWQARW